MSMPSIDLSTVGISPYYWSHVPMTVQQLNELKLVDGIFCWSNGDQQYVPIMKCLLVGCIVSRKVRASDEALLYVIDDGTGLIDCYAWAKTSDDLYHLPVLTRRKSTNQSAEENCRLGDIVRIFGKIQCVAAIRDMDVVVKEVQISLIDRVVGSQWDIEMKHWKACIDREESMIRDPNSFTAVKYLNVLGTTISTQVSERRMLPSRHDTNEEWRVFGLSCSCHLPYKMDLLYCHCIADVERMDPQFIFRDTLLDHLLQLQSTQRQNPLRFLYVDIKDIPHLRQVASNIIEANEGRQAQTDMMKNLQIDSLFKNTFRRLRDDGILYLLNKTHDQYILITRRWVLEPYVKHNFLGTDARNFIRIDSRSTPHLEHVNPEKLLYITRDLSQQQQQQGLPPGP